MERLLLAFRLFFKVLANAALAERAARLLDDIAPTPTKPSTPATVPTPTPPVSTRSDALTLLSVLQREARLIDFLKEEITGYADAQIGAAVRDVHRDASAVLERCFALRPVMTESEGTELAIPAGADGGRIRLVGNVGATAPARGRLQHAGWQATKTDLPQFTGRPDAAKIVAPAEVEV